MKGLVREWKMSEEEINTGQSFALWDAVLPTHLFMGLLCSTENGILNSHALLFSFQKSSLQAQSGGPDIDPGESNSLSLSVSLSLSYFRPMEGAISANTMITHMHTSPAQASTALPPTDPTLVIACCQYSHLKAVTVKWLSVSHVTTTSHPVE